MTLSLDFSETKTPILVSVVSLRCFVGTSTNSGGDFDGGDIDLGEGDEGDYDCGEGDLDLGEGDVDGGETQREFDGSRAVPPRLDASLGLQF